MKAATGAILLAAVLAAPAAADIRVWSDRNREGEGKQIRRAVRDLRNLGFDDRISSLQADEPWEVCSEPLFRGDCKIVDGTVLNLRDLGMNNRITSLRRASEELIAELAKPPEPEPEPEPRKAKPVEPTSTKTTAAQSGKPEPRKAQADVEASNTMPTAAPSTPPEPVEAGASARAAAVPAARPSEPVTHDANTKKKTEPKKKKTETATPPASPTPVAREWWEGGDDGAGGPPQLELFEKPNYEGKRVRLEEAVSDLTQLDQSVGSLLVRSGSWKICSKPQFRGRCRTVNASGTGMPETPLIGSLRPEPD